MKVLLTTTIRGLGKAGEVVDVADGYGRNYLLPKKLAVKATKAAVNMAEQYRKRAAELEEQLVTEAEHVVSRLHGFECTIQAAADENGHLYGSVSEKEIHERLVDAGFDIDKSSILLDHHLKSVGQHVVPVKIHGDLKEEITVHILAE